MNWRRWRGTTTADPPASGTDRPAGTDYAAGTEYPGWRSGESSRWPVLPVVRGPDNSCVCDSCRFSEHDQCEGYLASGRRLRCLCRECLTLARLMTSGDVVPEPDGNRPPSGRPVLRLVRGDAARS